MYFVDRTAVVLKPTARFLEWLKSADENMPDLTIEQLRANCSVFLVPQFDEPEAVIAYLCSSINLTPALPPICSHPVPATPEPPRVPSCRQGNRAAAQAKSSSYPKSASPIPTLFPIHRGG